jgi:small subunit ribosomal protein S9
MAQEEKIEKAEKAETKEKKPVARKKKAEAAVPAAVGAVPEAQAKKEEKKPAKKKAKKSLAVIERGKRKESVARASVRKGFGRVRVNSRIASSYFNNRYLAGIAKEPLYYIGDKAKEIDVSVNVYGGGIVGQAQAARNAIANALASFFPDDNLKDKFLEIDRSMIIEDSRRVETKKFKGPKARARYQKSYR